MKSVQLGPDRILTVDTVYQVAMNPTTQVSLTKEARRVIGIARKVVETMLKEKRVVYGITTGFGKFKDVVIDADKVRELQRNLIISHAVGVGENLAPELVRASFVTRINSLSQGHSGIRLELATTALAMLNADICPIVPSQGSVGASGDLAPLSHMGLALIGEGDVMYKGKRMTAAKALSQAGIQPVVLGAKEGLAWNNGTSVMLGILSIVLVRSHHLAHLIDLSCALSLEALRGTSGAFRSEIHALRPHKGQIESAAHIRSYIKGSKLVDSVAGRVQDAYSIRCAPQVHGASRETIRFTQGIVDTELNSVTDNPLIIPETNEVISGGNFHGEPLAQAADALSIALAELASISERRTARLVDNASNEGLPLFLIHPDQAGLHSGLMMPQYTAAALVSENKVLAHPASVDSIPTSANQEDHVSMGNIAARKALSILKNAEYVAAIEFLTAVQAIDFVGPEKLGKKTRKAYDLVRSVSPKITRDRILHTDIVAIRDLVCSQEFLQKVEGSSK